MENKKTPYTDDTIVALATATGVGAISVIRLSGKEAIELADKVFKTLNGKPLSEAPSHTVHLGTIKSENQVIDECLATIFKGKKSYTGEPVVEFSCHGSAYITQEVIKLCLANGARLAQAGEFTKRAFLNGKLALNQAEAVADLIASDSKASHQVALQQMRGGFTSEIEDLRQELLNFASLIELELDFSEEDVEFADRSQFEQLLKRIKTTLQTLIQSFSAGNAIKNGIPVAIVGKPNAGKSTLLNTLLNEERAIVSDIAGTTRDTIEETLHIDGFTFRFIDTAGIRDTKDQIEAIGVEKAKEKIKKAQLILYLYNEKENTTDEVIHFVTENYHKEAKFILLHNKIEDLQEVITPFDNEILASIPEEYIFSQLRISAKENINIDELKKILSLYVKNLSPSAGNTIITNIRHYEALNNALQALEKVEEGMQIHLSGDLLAIDIRETLYHLGSITGAVSNDELLGNIFSRFCIGK
ncbi:tRNA uridine-5-carboxymethylaminomethyl(34) synthesis GTPase MnmE [uncultured Capnocytophaga sp.]|uniref:tRNA uridine-5-carboxymethylaminomethyl(34) synthesis GTPase MnmE n=1 Tax=uncultured Capnocytophaga sp. TaxID=159273 RepID=UPI0028E71420|nr:tRNA uridine-5-carboxymethylaminomethyl(34) synthesis GTPase MnmE [uncultured Capnocytophaga sp.]